MRKFLILTLVLVFSASVQAEVVKKADLAGTWYPSSKATLSSVLDSYLAAAKVESIKGDIKAIIVPHAGLIYSGPVAAYAYKAVQGKKYATVLVLGFCHRMSFDGISVYKEGYFETPLGLLEIDSQLASEIISRNEKIIFHPVAFKNENSIELELPFIKKVLPDSKIVPIAFGSSDFTYCNIMAEILADVFSKRDDVLLVVSTDMSHYHTYEEARRIDLKSIELLRDFAARQIYEKSIIGEQLFCGYMPVTTALLACKKIGADKITILQYANSGDITGDRRRVVGYVSAAIYPVRDIKGTEPKNEISNGVYQEIQKEEVQNETRLPPPEAPPEADQPPPEAGQPLAGLTGDPPSAETGPPAGRAGREVQHKGGEMLNENQRRKLLEITRNTIKTYLETGKVLEVKEDDPLFNKEMGAFVTLHKKGQLRGCIGNIIGKGPLYLTIRDMAIESATGDPRFPKVTLDELNEIDIEISVLSELEKVTDIERIEMGVHGVLVRKGFASGVFLPQVATETGWSKEEFLSNLCAHKAGLLPDAWKTGDVDIYIFAAEVFGEKE